MTDPTPPVPPAEPAAPAKKPGLVRWWGLIVLLVLALLVVLAVPFGLDPWLRGKVDAALADRGLELDPSSKLSVSLLGGRIHGEGLRVHERGKPEDVFTATALDADLAVLDSFRLFDVVFDAVVLEGLTGDLRRRGGKPPMAPGDEPGGGGVDWSKVNWAEWYQRAMDRYRKWADERKQAEEKKPEPGQQPQEPQPQAKTQDEEIPVDWPKARKFKPTPRAERKYPRVVVRKLSVSGSGVKLPDASPFDVTSFSLTGTDVALVQAPGESMTLAGKVATAGAGPVDLDLVRKFDGTGTLSLSATQVPVEALANPAIAGDQFAKYGATGLAAVTVANTWQGWDLHGTVDALVQNLKLVPQAGAPKEALEAARVAAELHGRPIRWPIQLGGKLYAPSITDSGIEAVIKGSAADAARGYAEDKATQEAQKRLDQQLQKNPQAGKAVEGVKDLFKRK